MVSSAAESIPMAEYKTGFWADHWTYYLDIIESYLSIYPDGEESLLYEKKLKFFFSPASVLPRRKKYVLSLSFDGSHKHVRQLGSTVEDEEKKKYKSRFVSNTTGWFTPRAFWQSDKDGNVFESDLIVKLFLLGTIKFSTRDPYGMGIEYEAGRPGWDDAHNGLPGMPLLSMFVTFGSILKIILLHSRSYYRYDWIRYARGVRAKSSLGFSIKSHQKVPATNHCALRTFRSRRRNQPKS
jgi:hypothetical protein